MQNAREYNSKTMLREQYIVGSFQGEMVKFYEKLQIIHNKKKK